jgi:outer membrane receptor protein involved in Fe transport
MNLMFIRLLSVCSAMFYGSVIFAQSVKITGSVKDADSNQPIPFVNISVKDMPGGTASDLNGKFELSVPAGLKTLIFSAIGYEKVTRVVEVKTGASPTLNISMLQTSKQLDIMVVSASKYETKQQELTSSVEVIKPTLVENKNVTSIDKAIEQTPGVAIVDNEPQIRGGSGFSSGLGSRVMILVDDIPLMRGDAGRPVWGFIPIENVEQIEVLKGASSVLYGSSALNGAINVRTAFAKEKPITKITLMSGLYSRPDDPAQSEFLYGATDSVKPYKKRPIPFFSGLSAMHARKIDNFDFVVAGNLFWDESYIGPENRKIIPPGVPPLADYDALISPNNRGKYEKRARVNFSTRIRNKKVEGLVYGINGNIMYQEEGQTYFWLNDSAGMYNAFPGSLINFKNLMFYVDPYISYTNKSGDKHSLRGRYFYSDGKTDRKQATRSDQYYVDYQYQRLFKKLNFNLITGLTATYTNSRGEVFIGTPDGQNKSNQLNASLYTQIEKKFFKRLTVQGGARFEYFEINGQYAGKPVFRAGTNLMITEGTYMRASIGQGYRFPSIGERYIVTSVGGFGFYPNPDLKPETSWSTEYGIKQMFRIKNFVGFVDVVGFYQRYNNFVEFYAGLWGAPPPDNPFDIGKRLGFKFVNTGKAVVYGGELSIGGMGKIAKNVELQIMAGYTYSRPLSLSKDRVVDSFISNPATGAQFRVNYNNSSAGDSTTGILKYRIEHLAKFDAEIFLSGFESKGGKIFNGFSIGASVRYYSGMRNIDRFFIAYDKPTGFGTGITNYAANNKGKFTSDAVVIDARLGYELKKHFRFGLIMNNILNKAYTLRPMSPEAPRATSLQVVYKI